MSSAAPSTTLDQSTSAGVSTSVVQDTTGVTTAPGTTVVSTASQTSSSTQSSSSASSTSAQSTAASSTTALTSSSTSSVTTQSSTSTSTSQSITSTTVVTVPPSTTTDPSSTSVVSTPPPTSSSEAPTSETSAAPEATSLNTSSSISVASSTGAGGTIYRTTVVYTYVSSTRTGTSTSRSTGLAGSSGSGSGGGSNTGAIVGGVVGGVGGLALLAAAAFFLLKRRKKARATVLDEKMFDPGYGRSNSVDLLGGAGNTMGSSPVETSHISPFTGGHNSSAYAEAAAAAGLGAGAAGAYALHDRTGYGASAADGYDNMTTTGGGSSMDDHTSYTHGMQPVNPYVGGGYPSHAAYPSPALNRTDYPPELPNESMRSPRWSGGWGVAAMGGVGAGAEGQPGPYYSRDYAGGPAYPSPAPHASDVVPLAAAPASTAAAAKRREAQNERTNAAYAAAGPTSVGSTSWQGDGHGDGSSAVGETRRVSQGPDATGRRASDVGLGSAEDYQRPDVMVHTDGRSLLESSEAEEAVELPPTYTSIRPEDQRK